MNTILLVSLLIIDIILLVAFFYLRRRQEDQVQTLNELTEERHLIASLRESVRTDLQRAQEQSRSLMERISHIAMEVEQEVKNGGESIAQHVDGVVGGIAKKLDEPLSELARRQTSLEALYKKVERQKLSLRKMIERGERIISYLNDSVPYETIMKDIEEKKYRDARQLLATGFSPPAVARELGISESEVRLIVNLHPS